MNGKKSIKKIIGISLGMLIFMSLTACGATIEGTVSYRERIRLLPGAELRVSIVEQTADGEMSKPVAEIMRKTNLQIPIPFCLEYEHEVLQSQNSYHLVATLTTQDQQTTWCVSQPFEIDAQTPEKSRIFNLFLRSAATGKTD